MKAMLIDGECAGPDRRRCGLPRCTVLYFICNGEEKRDTFHSKCEPAELSVLGRWIFIHSLLENLF